MGDKLRRGILGSIAGLLVLVSCIIQFFGGNHGIPSWKQLRAAWGIPLAIEESAPQPAESYTAVYFLDVGQGDAVLIYQDGAYCLIDTGPAEAESVLLYDLDALNVSSLDYLILTHPHADHTGNVCAVLQKIPVKEILLPLWIPQEDDTADWPRRMMQIAADAGTSVVTAEAGEEYPLGSGTLEILQGGSDGERSVNDISLCTMFTAGSFRFLDTGDAEESAEQQLLDTYGSALHATLFKAGHHGSYTSNSLSFLQAVHPQVVAVSCGLHNDYGHPHRAALENFAAVGAELWRTDLQGSLTFLWKNNILTVETTTDSDGLAA